MNKEICRTEYEEIEPKGEKEIIENIIEETGCKIEKIIWKSIDCPFVQYDFEPFLGHSFTVSINVIGEKQNIKYLDYVIQKRIKRIEHLEKCLER